MSEMSEMGEMGTIREWRYLDRALVQQGPVDQSTLLELSDGGKILANTMVWREGMDAWKPWIEMAREVFPPQEDGERQALGVSAQSHRVLPAREMLPYGEALIAFDEKEIFVQHLLERGTTGIEDATIKRMPYVGFWMRLLAAILDNLIKSIPSMIFAIPQYIVIFSGGMGSPGEAFGVMYAAAVAIGQLGQLAVSIFYETWMVGKYGGTLGKTIIQAKIVRPDGSPLTYKQAFIRWLAKFPLAGFLSMVPFIIGLVLIGYGIGQATDIEGGATMSAAVIGGIVVSFVTGIFGTGVFWMAAFDSEKRTLYDRVASTRVVKK